MESVTTGVLDLSEEQLRLLECRMDLLKRLLPLKGIKLVFENGAKWTWGVLVFEAALWPPLKPSTEVPKKRMKIRANRKEPGEKTGDLSAECAPWVEMAMDSPGGMVTIYPEDFKLKFDRVLNCMSSLAIQRYGKGSFRVQKEVYVNKGVLCKRAHIWSTLDKFAIEMSRNQLKARSK